MDDINIRRRTPKLKTLSFLNVDISIVHAESCAGSYRRCNLVRAGNYGKWPSGQFNAASL